jgi:cyclic pyranopterin phosphate synthase
MNVTSDKKIGPRDRFKRPISDLRISLLDQCNFRCTYCMPEKKFHQNFKFLTKQERLTHDEILRLITIAVDLGVTKIRLTGGEPLLDKKIVSLVNKISKIDGITDLALTTNGTLLRKYADDLKKAGLHRITVSLDSLDPKIFYKLNGNKGDLKDVLDGILAAEESGFKEIKINTVVQRNVNENSIIDLLSHFRGTGHVVRLIEFMDVGNKNNWNLTSVISAKELIEHISQYWKLIPRKESYVGEVAKRYAYADGMGEIGFITSVSNPFCGDCSRARIAANGMLYTCLFATDGTDLRKLIRDGADNQEIQNVFSRTWLERSDRYSELRGLNKNKIQEQKIEMYRMGG